MVLRFRKHFPFHTSDALAVHLPIRALFWLLSVLIAFGCTVVRIAVICVVSHCEIRLSEALLIVNEVRLRDPCGDVQNETFSQELTNLDLSFVGWSTWKTKPQQERRQI